MTHDTNGGNGEAEFQPAGATAALLRDEAVWVAPPIDLFDRIVATVVDSPPPALVTAPAAPAVDVTRSRSRRPAWVLAAAAVVTGLVFGVGFVLGVAGRDDESAADDDPVAELALVGTDLAPDAAATVEVFDRGAGYALILATTGLEPAAEGTYYEGWLRADSGEEVSVGTFHMRGGDDDVVLWSGVPVEQFPTLVVTRRSLDDPAFGAEVMSGSLASP